MPQWTYSVIKLQHMVTKQYCSRNVNQNYKIEILYKHALCIINICNPKLWLPLTYLVHNNDWYNNNNNNNKKLNLL